MSLGGLHRSGRLRETLELGERLAASLPGGSVVLLEGELGAGKTQFVKGLARGLGLDPDEVVSPTFLLVQVHENPAGLGLVHVDLYRLGEASELLELGLEELPGPARVAAIEWPERLEGSEAPACWRVRIEDRGEHERELVVTPPPSGAKPPGRIR